MRGAPFLRRQLQHSFGGIRIMSEKDPYVDPLLFVCLSSRFLFCSGSIRAFFAPSSGTFPPCQQIAVTETHEGFTAKIGNENLRLTVCIGSMIHVMRRTRRCTSPPIASSRGCCLRPNRCPAATFQIRGRTATAPHHHRPPEDRISLSSAETSPTARLADDGLLREDNAIPRTYERTGERSAHLSRGRPLFARSD